MKLEKYKSIFEESSYKGTKLLLKNTERAPNLGSRFGQDVEPTGFYCLLYNEKYQKHMLDLPNYELYSFNFKNPLIVDVTEDAVIWKKELSQQYKAKGKQLTKKLMQDGYDSIITINKKYNETGEIIVLNTQGLKKI